MLSRRFKVAVVEVVLVVWNRPVVPKLVPVEEALMKTVLKETLIVEELVDDVMAMPLIELLVAVPLAAAGAVKLPIRLLNTLSVVPPVIRMPSTAADELLLDTDSP